MTDFGSSATAPLEVFVVSDSLATKRPSILKCSSVKAQLQSFSRLDNQAPMTSNALYLTVFRRVWCQRHRAPTSNHVRVAVKLIMACRVFSCVPYPSDAACAIRKQSQGQKL